jgi:hypothetical protein
MAFWRRKTAVEQEADVAYRRWTGTNPWIWVLPWGWVLHVWHPWHPRYKTFLARCADTGCFRGIDWQWRQQRIVCLRLNHLPHEHVWKIVKQAEAARKPL